MMFWKVFFLLGLLFPLEGHLQLTFMLVFIFNLFIYLFFFFFFGVLLVFGLE